MFSTTLLVKCSLVLLLVTVPAVRSKGFPSVVGILISPAHIEVVVQSAKRVSKSFVLFMLGMI